MRTVPRGAGGAIPRPLLHLIERHPGSAAGRCPESLRRCPPSIASRARPPPRAPGGDGIVRLELHERKGGSTKFGSMMAGTSPRCGTGFRKEEVR